MSGLRRKTIRQNIERKLNSWLKTLPEEIRNKVEDDLVVTGGAIASMLLGETVNDYDVYCQSYTTSAILAAYYVKQFNHNRKESALTELPVCKNVVDADGSMRVAVYIKSTGVAGEAENVDAYDYFEQSADSAGAAEYLEQIKQELPEETTRYRPVFLSENAITLSDQIQVIIRFTGAPEEIRNNFDYVHATNHYDSKTKQLVLKPDALESLLSKSLVYRGSRFPICSLFRMRKFLDRGWSISAGEILKMAAQVSELDLNNAEVLREHVLGLDTNYFLELLRMIEEFKAGSPGKPMELSYIVQLIDKLSI